MNYHADSLVEPQFTEIDSRFCRETLRSPAMLYIGCLLMELLMAMTALLTNFMLAGIAVYWIIIVVHLFYRYKEFGKSCVLSFDVVFILFYSIVHMSYVSLYAVRLAPKVHDVLFFPSAIPGAIFISSLGIVSFLFGYEVIGLKARNVLGHRVLALPNFLWGNLGLSLMIAGIASHVFVLAYMTPHFIAKGYNALQNISDYADSYFIVLLWSNCPRVMILGLVIYMFYSMLSFGKLFKSKLALTLFISYVVLAILEGDRGPIIQLGLPVLLMRHFFVQRIKVRYLVVVFLGALFLYTFLGFARDKIFNISEMRRIYSGKKEEGMITWVTPFVSLGGSFRTVNITYHEVPKNEPYWKGASWLGGITHIVPFLQGYIAKQGFVSNDGWFRWGPSTWVTITYFGVGAGGKAFTISAEGYLNFGYLGVFLELFFFGSLIRYVMIKFAKKMSIEWGVIMLGWYGLMVYAIRNHVGNMFNPMAHMFIIVWFFSLFIRDEAYIIDDIYPYYHPEFTESI